jgi:AcrR family transcriptional regulator
VQDNISSTEPSLRERKRAETHARIQAEGMRLFLDKGFEATTLDEVAAAAEVSRRTLLNYFGSKEEIVFSTKADFPQFIADAVAARPAAEPLLDMVENALIDLAERHRSDQARAVAALICATPSLHAGDQAKYERIERLLAKTLAAWFEPSGAVQRSTGERAARVSSRRFSGAWKGAPLKRSTSPALAASASSASPR